MSYSVSDCVLVLATFSCTYTFSAVTVIFLCCLALCCRTAVLLKCWWLCCVSLCFSVFFLLFFLPCSSSKPCYLVAGLKGKCSPTPSFSFPLFCFHCFSSFNNWFYHSCWRDRKTGHTNFLFNLTRIKMSSLWLCFYSQAGTDHKLCDSILGWG